MYAPGNSTQRGGRLRGCDVHDDVAEAEESFRVERLREEVGDVIRIADEGGLKLERLDHVASVQNFIECSEEDLREYLPRFHASLGEVKAILKARQHFYDLLRKRSPEAVEQVVTDLNLDDATARFRWSVAQRVQRPHCSGPVLPTPSKALAGVWGVSGHFAHHASVSPANDCWVRS